MGKQFENSSYISSLILEEIKENPIDLITVICKVYIYIIILLAIYYISGYLSIYISLSLRETVIFKVGYLFLISYLLYVRLSI